MTRLIGGISAFAIFIVGHLSYAEGLYSRHTYESWKLNARGVAVCNIERDDKKKQMYEEVGLRLVSALYDWPDSHESDPLSSRLKELRREFTKNKPAVTVTSSFAVFLEQHKQLNVYSFCSCLNSEQFKIVPDEKTFQSYQNQTFEVKMYSPVLKREVVAKEVEKLRDVEDESLVRCLQQQRIP